MPDLPDLTPETLAVRPLDEAETIPSSWYTDPRVHAFEQAALFPRAWQYAGHEAMLAAPGDFVTAEVAGNPLLLVRADDGAVRAFYNVCRHRGGPLAMEERGHVTMLQCKYHGWTYRLDGSLRGVPRFDRSKLFDRRDYGLAPVDVRVWEGLLFVRLDGAAGGPEPGELLAGVAERIAPERLGRLRFHGRTAYDVACNWKVYVDNYLEGYHIPLVHPELCDVLDYRAYVTESARWHSLQHSPLRAGGAVYGEGAAYYYYLWPNAMLNVLPGRLQMNLVVPLAPDRCRVLFDAYYADVETPEAQARIAADLAFSDRVQAEDAGICAHVQRGLASRGYDRGRFSPDCEAGVHHFQALLKEAYRDALAGGA